MKIVIAMVNDENSNSNDKWCKLQWQWKVMEVLM